MISCRELYQTDDSLVQGMAGNWDRPKSAGNVIGITGTVLWASLSVLEGGQHTVSSMLEGLFLSALSISCNGKLYGRYEMKPHQLHHCANLRRGHLTTPALSELQRADHWLAQFVLPPAGQ